ncbi:hypothetical protein Tco_0686917 [Tanacetum coccineum]
MGGNTGGIHVVPISLDCFDDGNFKWRSHLDWLRVFPYFLLRNRAQLAPGSFMRTKAVRVLFHHRLSHKLRWLIWPGHVLLEVAHRKRVKYEANADNWILDTVLLSLCLLIHVGSLRRMRFTLLKRIRQVLRAQELRQC